MGKGPAGLRSENSLVHSLFKRLYLRLVIPAPHNLRAGEKGIDVRQVPVIIALLKPVLLPLPDVSVLRDPIGRQTGDNIFPKPALLLIQPQIPGYLQQAGEKLLHDGNIHGGILHGGAWMRHVGIFRGNQVPRRVFRGHGRINPYRPPLIPDNVIFIKQPGLPHKGQDFLLQKLPVPRVLIIPVKHLGQLRITGTICVG